MILRLDSLSICMRILTAVVGIGGSVKRVIFGEDVLSNMEYISYWFRAVVDGSGSVSVE